MSLGFAYLEASDRGGEFEGSIYERWAQSCWFSLQCLFFVQEKGIHSLRGRLLMFVWCFTVLVYTTLHICPMVTLLYPVPAPQVITATYTANTVSFLVSKEKLPLSITDIEDCRGKRIGVSRSSAYWERMLLAGFDSELLDVDGKNPFNMLERGDLDGYVLFGSDYQDDLRLCEEYNPKFEMVIPAILPGSASFMLSKDVGKVFRHKLNQVLLQMMATGEVGTAKRQARRTCQAVVEEPYALRLSIDHFLGLIVLVVSVCVVCVASQLIEDACKSTQQQNRPVSAPP